MSGYSGWPGRWGVLASVMLTNMTAFMVTTCYFTVTPAAANYFEVDETEVDLLALINLAIVPVFMLLAVYVTDRYGLKVKHIA